MRTNLKKYMRLTEDALELKPGKWIVELDEGTNWEGKGCTSIFWREESGLHHEFDITAAGELQIRVFEEGTNKVIKEFKLDVIDEDSKELEIIHEFLFELEHLGGRVLAPRIIFTS